MYVRTFAEECLAFEQHNQTPGLTFAEETMFLCLAELVRRAGVSCACHRFAGYIDVSLAMRPDRYYGTGAPLYRVNVEGEASCIVRAPDRKALRAALKRIFPNARIGR